MFATRRTQDGRMRGQWTEYLGKLFAGEYRFEFMPKAGDGPYPVQMVLSTVLMDPDEPSVLAVVLSAMTERSGIPEAGVDPQPGDRFAILGIIHECYAVKVSGTESWETHETVCYLTPKDGEARTRV